jgi:hypothetical protein
MVNIQLAELERRWWVRTRRYLNNIEKAEAGKRRCKPNQMKYNAKG